MTDRVSSYQAEKLYPSRIKPSRDLLLFACGIIYSSSVFAHILFVMAALILELWPFHVKLEKNNCISINKNTWREMLHQWRESNSQYLDNLAGIFQSGEEGFDGVGVW